MELLNRARFKSIRLDLRTLINAYPYLGPNLTKIVCSYLGPDLRYILFSALFYLMRRTLCVILNDLAI